MRIVKQRLLEMIPELRVFLDVDDLEDISDLESYISRSSVVLVFCSEGYFQSKNCMRELQAAVYKPLVALLEPDKKRGGMSLEEVKQQVLKCGEKYTEWGFDDKPEPVELSKALLSHDPIEWNRIGEFQDVRRSADALAAPAAECPCSCEALTSRSVRR